MGAAPARAPRYRVIVVDDHADIAEWLADELTLLGHEVRPVNDGPAALELAVSFEPDVMLVDIALPEMNGWEIARRLRKLGLTKPPYLIAISALQQDAHRERSRLVGFKAHLVKPIKLAALQRELERVFEPPPAPPVEPPPPAPLR